MTETSIYMHMLGTCPCCGFDTAGDEYGICDVCRWEDDYVQRRHPDMTGANQVTLRQAQKMFCDHGICDLRLKEFNWPPDDSDVPPRRNPNWKPLPE